MLNIYNIVRFLDWVMGKFLFGRLPYF